jgi:uncharacterized membrane protein YfcA
LHSSTELILLAVISFFTSAMTAVVAVGGGAIMIATLLMFMPPVVAIPLQGMIQFVGACGRVTLMRRHIAWPIVWRVFLPLPLGAAVGLWLFQGMSQHTIELLIGTFVLLTIFIQKFKPLGDHELPLWGFVPLGFLVGALSVTVAVVAMFTGPFMLRKDLNRQAVNVTMATIALLGHLTKVLAFGAIGFRPQDHWAPFLVMVPSGILGVVLGERVLNRMSEELFLWLFRVTLSGLAAKLILWDGLLKPYVFS